jgi:catechol 2,3-dioxygenase-like lactoylglutathione lyase family enzyme
MFRGMTITHVQLVSLPVTDHDRARRFYTDVLGFDLVHDLSMGPGERWVQVRPSGAQTSITLVTWFDSMRAGTLRGLVLETDDLDRDVEELGRRGVPFDGDIRKEPWGRFATFTDPDGNSITLQATVAA